ncbi:MAG: helix-turn-helix transcriptional regulator [Pseudomonadota bacterium]
MASSLHSGKYSVLLELLIKTRKSSGFTQQQVADKLGKPQSYIAKIERGERRLDIVEFSELAKAMKADAVKLFEAWMKLQK